MKTIHSPTVLRLTRDRDRGQKHPKPGTGQRLLVRPQVPSTSSSVPRHYTHGTAHGIWVTSEKHREYREKYDDMFKYHDVTMCFTGLHGMKY
jgi:hypothetical protein